MKKLTIVLGLFIATLISSQVLADKNGGNTEITALKKQVNELQRQLKSAQDREDRRTSQLAEWFDEYHKNKNNSRQHRFIISGIK